MKNGGGKIGCRDFPASIFRIDTGGLFQNDTFYMYILMQKYGCRFFEFFS